MVADDIFLSYTDFIDELKSVSERETFYTAGFCPHCEMQAPLVHQSEDDSVRGVPQVVWAWSCRCGWWDIQRLGVLGPDTGIDDDGHEWAHAANWYRHGILRSLSSSDANVPVTALRRALADHPHLVHSLHPGKMEELVGSVMSDFIADCEVKHCGRTADGGVDLLLILSDSILAVQVKRRIRPDRVESVSAVREFLAAMKLQGIAGGVYVTTADHFSPQAKAEASRAVTLDLVRNFELVDRHRFFGMIEATTSAPRLEEWRRHIDDSPWF